MAKTAHSTQAGMTFMPIEAVMTYLHSINMTTDTKKSVGCHLVYEAQREATDSKEVMDFGRRFTEGMTGIDPEINTVIEDNFWEML